MAHQNVNTEETIRIVMTIIILLFTWTNTRLTHGVTKREKPDFTTPHEVLSLPK